MKRDKFIMMKAIIVFIICLLPVIAQAAGVSVPDTIAGTPISQYISNGALGIIGFFLARLVVKVDKQGEILFDMNTRLASLEGQHKEK